MKHTSLLSAMMLAALSLTSTAAQAQEDQAPKNTEKPTPESVVAAAADSEWLAIDPADLLVMQLAPDMAGQDRTVVIQLMPAPFSQPWTENIRKLAAAHWWDGTSIYRVVDNWVAQWGGGDPELDMDPGPMPDGVASPTSDYTLTEADDGFTDLARGFLETARERARASAINHRADERDREKAEAGEKKPLLTVRANVPPMVLLQDDPYAEGASFHQGWPIGLGKGAMWPVHCYASVGVARDLVPDTGTGSELYAVIGHAPRQLDRNIAVVGRVIDGIEHLSTLKRGTGAAGVYETREEDTPITSARMGDSLPEGRRPHFEYLDTSSKSFAQYAHIRANLEDSFYQIPAGGVDICNLPVPIREAGAE
ncbi:peptidylprolyl isomerase [Altererythrobacter atlanticus]|uniref:Cyclophilin type peptidyl-prolyl cis-trans isomerase/CLD n=1 Tax=Croceibacterium atlanticum TaxID=1267766 RepID=A0A0F7KZ40_9SPHN|nr:peptidylprolyl isomerase [Croceibacterium atlanticum]AKH44105.1 Cyclophilin type peptidyl-prolyl cis-trans isomerase/CLD [Croceibacterium atlanticum]MBB5732415.1 peptidylprolyl isomerase [Croceibacterium atlanticum]